MHNNFHVVCYAFKLKNLLSREDKNITNNHEFLESYKTSKLHLLSRVILKCSSGCVIHSPALNLGKNVGCTFKGIIVDFNGVVFCHNMEDCCDGFKVCTRVVPRVCYLLQYHL